MEEVPGGWEYATQKGAQGKQKRSTLDEILEKINEKYKGKFSEGDRVMLGALHDKLAKNEKSAPEINPERFRL